MTQPNELKICLLCLLAGIPEENSCKSVENGVKRHGKQWNTRTPDLSREQLIADVKRLRAALNNISGCYSAGTALLAREALAATDRPEYKEVE